MNKNIFQKIKSFFSKKTSTEMDENISISKNDPLTTPTFPKRKYDMPVRGSSDSYSRTSSISKPSSSRSYKSSSSSSSYSGGGFFDSFGGFDSSSDCSSSSDCGSSDGGGCCSD